MKDSDFYIHYLVVWTYFNLFDNSGWKTNLTQLYSFCTFFFTVFAYMINHLIFVST